MDEVKKLEDEKSGQKIVPEFLGDLPRRNTRKYSVLKILFRYVLLLTLSFVSGMLFCKGTGDQLLLSKAFFDNISAHFYDVFEGCDSFQSYSSVIISSSASDIRYLLLIFASGFTYFCGIADSAFIICKGFTVGFSLNYLISALKAEPELLQNPNAAIIIFAVSEIAVAAFMVFLATKTLIFAYEFRKLRGRKSRIVKSPVIYRYMLLYLTAFGLILMLNVSSCIASLLIYR